MYSPRLLAALAVLAAVAALPTEKSLPKPVTTITDDEFEDAPWFSFPYFGNLFAPLWKLFPTFNEIGPKIVFDENKCQVIVGVKDYKKDELKVKVKEDLILVQGSHETKQDERELFASQFFHTYTLPANSSGAEVTAELSSDGYLVITAPINKGEEKAKPVDREVPIVETGVPYQKDEKDEKTTVSPPAPLDDEDRKEPTTAPSVDREETTETDNNTIPHGSEINP